MKKTIFTLAAAALVFSSCQDDWNEHYDQQADSAYGTSSLYEIIASRPELSDFRAVLDSARLFAGNRISATHYSQLLAQDQFLTVWAPVNGTFNRDSLLQLCQTTNGDSLVELHFLKNHIARYPQSFVPGKERAIRMLNAKTLRMADGTYGDAQLRETNIASRNGVLHILNQPATYRYNIYEALYSLPEFQHVGKFLKSYQIDEFDETSSLAMGVVDGKTVYVDSVFYTWNRLLYTYGLINSEDSTYWMMVPPADVWKEKYAEASTYYQFGSIGKADSIHDYWTNYALLQDLVFNPHEQLGYPDSLCSTTWSRMLAGEYHVFYNPRDTKGLMAYVQDSLICSNGNIYRLREWPQSMNRSYFRKIVKQAESGMFENFEAAGKALKIEYRSMAADSISGNSYISVNPQTQYDKYYVTYEVGNVLSGCYDVKVVMLPKTVWNPNLDPNATADKKHFRPNKFAAEITFAGTDGKEYTVKSGSRYTYDSSTPGYYIEAASSDKSVDFLFDCNLSPSTAGPVTNRAARAFTNDPYRVDTIQLATIHFPTCNYDQQKITTRVKIQNAIDQQQAQQYNSEMLIDCILFMPHVDN